MFKLALALGKTVGEIEREMSSNELNDWMAYAQIEPFGLERGDLQAGIVAATVANVNRDRHRQRAFKPGDFMPDFEKPRAKKTGEQIFQVLRLHAEAHNASLKNG